MPPTTTPTADPHGALAPSDLRLSRRELALIAAFWALFALLTVANRLVGSGESDPRAELFAGPVVIALAESLCWTLVTPVVFWLASRNELETDGMGASRAMRIARLVALGAVAAAAVTLIGHELRGVLGGFGPGGPPPDGVRGGRGGPRGFGGAGGPRGRRGGPPWFAFANAVLVYAGIYAAGLARAYSLRYRARREQTARLHAQLAEARLEALRRQLDPHFLFNTLNAVSALVERDPRGVRRMIARLSDLLRHSFEGPNEPEVALRDELALLGRYVDIMRVRFQGRLAVTTRADERALDGLVPSMILQPLVENAIKHGVERIAGEGRIEIDAAVEGDALVLRVSDNGPGPRPAPLPAAPSPAGGGVGVRNTVERLEQLYGGAQRFTLAPGAGGGTVAEVRLPFRTRGRPPSADVDRPVIEAHA